MTKWDDEVLTDSPSGCLARAPRIGATNVIVSEYAAAASEAAKTDGPDPIMPRPRFKETGGSV